MVAPEDAREGIALGVAHEASAAPLRAAQAGRLPALLGGVAHVATKVAGGARRTPRGRAAGLAEALLFRARALGAAAPARAGDPNHDGGPRVAGAAAREPPRQGLGSSPLFGGQAEQRGHHGPRAAACADD